VSTKSAPSPSAVSTQVAAIDAFFGSTADGKHLQLTTADQSRGVTEVMEQIAEREIEHEEGNESVTWIPDPGDSKKIQAIKQNVREWIVRVRTYTNTDALARAALYSKAGQLVEMTHERGYVDVDGEFHSTKDILRDFEKTFGSEEKRQTSGRWRSIHVFVEKQVDWLEDVLGIEPALILGVIREDAPTYIADVHGWIQRVRKWSKDNEDLRVTPDTLKEEVEWILKSAGSVKGSVFIKNAKERYANPEQGENGGVGEIPYSIHEMGNRRRVIMEMTTEQWDEYVRPSLSSALILDRDVGYEPIPIEMLARLVDLETRADTCRQVVRIKLLSEYNTSFVYRILSAHSDEALSLDQFEVFFPGEIELSRQELMDALDSLCVCQVAARGTDPDGQVVWWMLGRGRGQ